MVDAKNRDHQSHQSGLFELLGQVGRHGSGSAGKRCNERPDSLEYELHFFPRAEDGVPDAGEVGLPGSFEEIDGEYHTADDRYHRKEICGERATYTGDCRAHGGKPRLDGGEHQTDGPGRGDHSTDDDQHGTQGHGQGQEDPGQARHRTCELLKKQDGLRYSLDDRGDHRQKRAAENFSEVSDLLAQ